MSIKSRIRPLLPPTERAFSARANSLEQQIGALQGQVDELRRICDQQAKTIDTYSQLFSKQFQLSLYSNAEYSNPSRFRNILVAGWYGANNYGDELMMRTVLEHFSKEALTNVNVLLWDNDTYSRLDLPPQIGIIHYPNSTWQLEELTEMFDTIVWGGGSILDDQQFDNNPNNFNTGNIFIRLNLLAMSRGKEIWCLGLGANSSFSNQEYLNYLQQIVYNSTYFSIRDPYSLNVLSASGIDCSHIDLCNDLAFASNELFSLVKHRKANRRYDIGIVLLCVEELFDHYVVVLKSLLNSSFATAEDSIVLIPFLNEYNLDINYYKRLIACLGNDSRITIARYSSSLTQCALLESKFCICYKYHASLIANSLGIPGLHVVHSKHPHYSNKMNYVSNMFNYRDHLVDAQSFEQNPSALVLKLINSNRAPLLENHEIYTETSEWLQEVCARIESSLKGRSCSTEE